MQIYNDAGVIRASAILTNSYVAGTVLSLSSPAQSSTETFEYNQLVLLPKFTIGSLTDLQIKVEFSPDGTTYYQETYDAISAGTNTHSLAVHKLTATGNYRLLIPIKDRYIKISAIGTGTLTNSLLEMSAILGEV